MKIRSLSPEIQAKLRKNALMRNVDENFDKFLDLETDNFQNLFSYTLTTYTSVVEIS